MDSWLPERLSSRFPHADLPEQFVLGRSPRIPEGWATRSLVGFTLGRHASLPCIELTDGQGGALGWLLGYPIESEGRLLSDGDTLVCPESGFEAFEAQLAEFGGRFLAIVVDSGQGQGGPRVYLDSCGSLSAVYAPELELVASTPNLIPYEAATRDRSALVAEIGIPHVNAMYPVGMTPRHGVERLLPNHYLALDTWSCARYWPTRDLADAFPQDESVERIAELTTRNITALVDAMPCYLPITAGRDSRMLLACARQRIEELSTYTVLLPDRSARLDGRIARRLANRFALTHLALEMEAPKQADLDEWMWRIGCSTGEVRGWQAMTTYKRLDPARTHLLGNVGEVARHYYWRRADHQGTVLTPERLLEPCRVPATEETLERMRGWLDAVPSDDALHILDLFYMEQRLGCWGGVFPYADYRGPGFDIFPMCHREIVERMAALPVSMRRSGGLMQAVIQHAWPELLALPFNQDVGVRRLYQRVSRRARMLAARVPLPRRRSA